MRHIWTLAFAVACSTPPSSRPVAPAPPAAETAHGAADPTRIAPERAAGLYWLPYMTCDRCDPPAAIVAYVVGDAVAARAIMKAFEGKLDLGFPFAVHTDEIAIAPPGIAVVIGTHGSHARAVDALAPLAAVHGVRPAVYDLETDIYNHADKFGGTRRVTVVDRGGPVPAWSKDALDAARAALDASDDPDAHHTLESMHRWVQAQLHAQKPACTVQPGELFVVEETEIDWYEMAPVRCNGKLAYIEWTRSLLGHAVIVHAENGYRLYQVVGAECDSPIIEDWRYDAGGRHKEEPAPRVASAGGC
jgi:hypothetical protein